MPTITRLNSQKVIKHDYDTLLLMTMSSSTLEAVDFVLGAGARKGVRHTNLDGIDKNTEIPERCVRGAGGRGAGAGVREKEQEILHKCPS